MFSRRRLQHPCWGHEARSVTPAAATEQAKLPAGQRRQYGETPGVFTVDVEDWYHPLYRDPSRWVGLEDRVWVGTERLLTLLADGGHRATFFVLGEVAARHPELVRAIIDAGHEVGSHSHLHRPVNTLSPIVFRDDLRRSLDALCAAGATNVVAFRAPYFSLDSRSSWALDILGENGILIDSSVFPLRTGYYGDTGSPNEPYLLGPVVEVPITLPVMAGMRLPLAGGFYARCFPRRWTVAAARRVRAQQAAPVFYIHPWELDPCQPRVRVSPFLTFRHYLRLSGTEETVRHVLGTGRWVSIRRFVETRYPVA